MKLKHLFGGLALALLAGIVQAASLVVLPQQLVVDADGTPRSGARLYVFNALTSTPRASYTTNALAVAQAHPVEAVATGLFPAVYVNPDGGPYKLVLKDAADSIIWTEDNIPAGSVTVFPVIPAETAAGVTVVSTSYQPLDIRRYGAVCDYNAGAETDGQVPNDATDNLAAFDDAFDVAEEMGGGVIRVQGGGDCYVSNTIDGRDLSNLYYYVEPGTTLRTTRYTSSGTLLTLGHTGPLGTGISNVGVYGGGTIRNFQPDHDTIPAHAALTAYDLGDYVLSTDTNTETRAYYAKTAGTSGAASPPDVVSGSDTDGTVVWQDADNDNVISIQADGVRVDGMDIPTASGKPISIQVSGWANAWITNNRIGSTNDKGIEVKGNQAIAGQEAAFGDTINIVGNTLVESGYEGIEIDNPTFSSALNKNCRIIGNLVRSAGTVDTGASGIRVHRCRNVEIRGNKVLNSGGNGFHIRLSENITGDLHSESAGVFGVHLQENSGFSFESIYVKDSVNSAVKEADDVLGGFVGRLHIDSDDPDGDPDDGGWETTSRDGPAPVIASYSITTLGDNFIGVLPSLLPQAAAAKIQSFTLQLTNSAGTLQHRFIDDIVNAGASSFADRITAASATLTNTPVAADASTAFAAGGKVSSANTNEFILNHANAAVAAAGIKLCSITQNDTDIDAIVGVVRRSVDVNGATLSRWHLQYRQTSDGAALALNTTNIAASETIAVSCLMYLP